MDSKRSFISTFLTGVVLILSIGIVVKVYTWLWGYVYEFISPIEKLLSNFIVVEKGFLLVISFFILLAFSFLLGFFIKLIAKNKYDKFLSKTLYKIPFFKIVQEAVHQLIAKDDNNSFDRKCIAQVYSDAYSIGYIVDEMEKDFVVYIPTAPVVSSGMIFVVSKDKVKEIYVDGSDMLKIILSCGIGAGDVIEDNRKSKEEYGEKH